MLSAPAAGTISVSLTPAERPDPAVFPYQPAVLTIDNQSSAVLRTVTLRLREGGPAVRYESLVSPQAKQAITVNLPAISTNQTYTVDLQYENAACEKLRTGIAWPVDWVAASRSAFIDFDAYKPWEQRLPTWPENARLNSLVFAIIGCLSAGAVLLIRRQALRLATLAFVIVAFTACTIYPLATLPSVQAISQLSPADPETQLALASRRTTDYTLPESNIYPVYRNIAHLERDALIMQPGQTISLHLEPGEIRIFRRMGPTYPQTSRR